MRRCAPSGLLLLLGLLPAQGPSGPAAKPAPPRAPAAPSGGAPFPRGEVLTYTVNWPSGLSLGEAQLKAGGGEPGWQFEFHLEASLPGFEVRDHYRSSVSERFCSETLEKEFAHGSRKGREKVRYDPQKHVAERETVNGGKSEVAVADCVKDGLAFFFFLRRELAAGRIPPAQAVNFGAPYQVSVAYAGSSQIEVGGVRQPSDRVQVSLRGPASQHSFEIYFGRDPARKPLLIRAPFPLGTFALELVP